MPLPPPGIAYHACLPEPFVDPVVHVPVDPERGLVARNHRIEVGCEPRVQTALREPGPDALRARRVVGDDHGREPGRFGLLQLRLDERSVLGVPKRRLDCGEPAVPSAAVPDGSGEIGEPAADLEVGPRLVGDALEQEVGPERCSYESHSVDRDHVRVEQRHAMLETLPGELLACGVDI